MDENFANNVKLGDIVVAGTNFGCGSSREHAAITLSSCGVSIVLADSFARIFYRNATNLALPLMICEDINKKVITGDILEINLRGGLILNKTTNEEIIGEKISDYIFNIIQNGGIKKLLRKLEI